MKLNASTWPAADFSMLINNDTGFSKTKSYCQVTRKDLHIFQ